MVDDLPSLASRNIRPEGGTLCWLIFFALAQLERLGCCFATYLFSSIALLLYRRCVLSCPMEKSEFFFGRVGKDNLWRWSTIRRTRSRRIPSCSTLSLLRVLKVASVSIARSITLRGGGLMLMIRPERSASLNFQSRSRSALSDWRGLNVRSQRNR